jgi:dTDP-4-dehydrorhamnose reductase
VIVNAASRQADWATTAEGGMHVDLAAAMVGARLVHMSSDAVFSGTTARYDETHVPAPTTPYGGAKAAETAIKGITPTAVIAQTSLIISDGDSPHERHVHALAAGAATGALFTDDVRCPVHVSDLASALLELGTSPYAGIHHVAGTDASAATSSACSSHTGTVSTKPPFLPRYAPAPASPDPSTCGWTAPTPKRG